MTFGTLLHLIYFEKLAETEEGTAEWNAITGGLIVLRMLDTWHEFGKQSLRENKRGISNIRKAVGMIEEQNPIRGVLLSLMKSIETANHPDVSTILPPLLEYGLLLQAQKQYKLAADVCETVIGYSPGPDATRLTATMQLGQCCRVMGDWEAAAQHFAEAGQIAASAGDQAAMLLARIADAQLTADRGNFAQAQLLLDDVITQTKGVENLKEVWNAATGEAAQIAILRGDAGKSEGTAAAG